MEYIKITDDIKIEWDSDETTENHMQGVIHKKHIGKYTVIRELGQGGEGCVYLARDEDLQRLVAIKKVNRKEQDREEEKQLMKEADFLQQFRHPMLPIIYDLLWEDDWYLVMEYIQGTTLRDYIERNGYVQEERACAWAEQLLDILQYLHTRKTPVIYRDLKPDNIMVCPDGHLKLVDFGAAFRRSFGGKQEHGMAATVGYAAPEQYIGEQDSEHDAPTERQPWFARKAASKRGYVRLGQTVYADERSDIYAFGKVFYYIVTGADPAKPPYTSLSIRDYQPLLSDRLERLIRKCIKDDPSERYQIVAEVRRDLDRCGKRKRRLRRKSFIRVIEKKVWLTEG